MPRPALFNLAFALILTGLNMTKPAVVDDAAYLCMAAHLADRPWDPYGFEQFWYAAPEPAMHVLVPPVVPYLLAIGFSLFGPNLPLVKLALFPVAYGFVWAIRVLLRRFAPGTELVGMALFACSAGVLPLVNCMLDVPTAAFSLLAVATFMNATDTRRGSLALLAGGFAAMAIQTKYSALSIPLVLMFWGCWTRQLRLTTFAITSLLSINFLWESYLYFQYHESHFLRHIQSEAGGSIRNQLIQKLHFFEAHAIHWGWLAAGWGVIAAASAFPRWMAGCAVAALVIGIAVMLTGWYGVVSPQPAESDWPGLRFSRQFGLIAALAWGVCLGVGLWRVRADRLMWFLVGWLAIEAFIMGITTPFPAGRRVVMVGIVTGLIVLRIVALTAIWPRAMFGVSIIWGLLFFAMDCWDAHPEKRLAIQSAQYTPNNTTWTQGHWGWQYYTQQLGYQQVIPNTSELHAGDWVVLPIHPRTPGFHRPEFGGAEADFTSLNLKLIAELIDEDALHFQTVPALYGGLVPVLGRTSPRLVVRVYQVQTRGIPTQRR